MKDSKKIWKMKGCSMKGGNCGCGGVLTGGSGGTGAGCGCNMLTTGGKMKTKKYRDKHHNKTKKIYLVKGQGQGQGQAKNKKGGNSWAFPNGAQIGAPWTGNVSTWPGVQGLDGQTNYFALNKYIPFDPQTQGIVEERSVYPAGYPYGFNPAGLRGGSRKGGNRKNKSKSKNRINKKGGGIFLQDLKNFGNNLTYNINSSWNALRGNPAPVNPAPYKDQFMHNT
jgi:hypothetical protein